MKKRLTLLSLSVISVASGIAFLTQKDYITGLILVAVGLALYVIKKKV